MALKREILTADDDGTVTLKKEWDFQSELDRNAALRSGQSDYRPFAGNDQFHHVASIPMGLIEKWMIEDGCNYLAGEGKEKLIARLNSNDHNKLRIKPGRI